VSYLGDLVDSASAVLFDFFHTLSSIETTHDALPPESWEIMNLDRKTWHQAWEKITPARLDGEITDPYELLSIPAKAVDPAVDEQLIHTAVQTRLGKFARAVLRIDDSVLWTLQVLRNRGKRLGLISNADAIQIASWGESPLHDAFDTVLFSCQVGLVKPDKRIYLRACHDLAVSPAECLFVGDGGSEELRGAKAVGMKTVQATGILAKLWPETIEERGRCADCRIDNIEALIDAAQAAP
jgi:putative hydrolase of the HAD superfamily